MANHKMTFDIENGITKAKIDGVYMGGGKAAQVEASEEQIKDVVEDTVKANPELSGTEPNLEGIELSGDKYAVPQGGGTEVVANPTLVGTEDNLTALQVGETKYKVPQGGGGSELGEVITIDSANFEVIDTYFFAPINSDNTLYRVGLVFKHKTTNEKYVIVCTTDENVENWDFYDPDNFQHCIGIIRGGDLVLKGGNSYFAKMGVVCQYTSSSSTDTMIQILK